MDDKSKINPEVPKPEDIKPINTVGEEKPTVGTGPYKIPHIGKRTIKPLDLFRSGPFRGGSLGNKKP